MKPITGMAVLLGAAWGGDVRIPTGSFESEPEGHRALADRRGDPLGRAAADVAHGEDARAAGLQRGARLRRPGPVRTNPSIVEVDQAAEPAGAGPTPMKTNSARAGSTSARRSGRPPRRPPPGPGSVDRRDPGAEARCLARFGVAPQDTPIRATRRVMLGTEVRELLGRARPWRRSPWRTAGPAGGSAPPARALFVFIGVRPCTGWLGGLVDLDDRGFVRDRPGPTVLTRAGDQLPGIFAVGDVRSGSAKRVATAVGEGAMAIRLAFERTRSG